MHKSLFGAVIKKLRVQRGYSQERLASLADLERTFISMLERGVKQPSLKTIGGLARAFELKNYELLHLVEQEIHSVEHVADDAFVREQDQRELDALVAEQEKLRIGEIVDSIPVVFFARSPMPEYAANFVSRNVSQLLGFDREYFVGPCQFWLERIHPEDRPRVLDLLQNMKVNGLINQEYRFRTASGQWLHIWEELRLIADEAGAPREVLGSMTGELCEG